jgi:hypothetical protein
MALGRLVLSAGASTRRGVLVGQPLHERHRRVPRAADLIANGIEGARQAVQLAQVELAVAEGRGGALVNICRHSTATACVGAAATIGGDDVSSVR